MLFFSFLVPNASGEHHAPAASIERARRRMTRERAPFMGWKFQNM
jgi:hypothetical protein